MESGMAVCKNHDTLNPHVQRPKSLRRIDYAFYFGSIPLNLAAWAALEVTLPTSLPLITVAGNVAAPVLGLQNKDALGEEQHGRCRRHHAGTGRL